MNIRRLHRILIFLLLTTPVFSADWFYDDQAFNNNGDGIIWKNNAETLTIIANPSATESYTWILPADKGIIGTTWIIESIDGNVVTWTYGPPSPIDPILDVIYLRLDTANLTDDLSFNDFSITDILSLTSSNAIAIKPSGDNDDYLSFSTVNGTPTITRQGGSTFNLLSSAGNIFIDYSDGNVLFGWVNDETASVWVALGEILIQTIGNKDINLTPDGTGIVNINSDVNMNSNSFTTVVGGILPTASSHLATKEYVDSAITFIEEYYFTDTLSNIGGIYFDMIDMPTGEVVSEHSISTITNSDDQPLVNFATVAGVPGLITLDAGIYGGNIHALKSAGGQRAVTIYFEIHSRIADSPFTETLLTTSEESALLTTVEKHYILHATLSEDASIAATDRIIIKWFANGGGGGGNATVLLRQEGITAARLNVPISSNILSQIYLRQDGQKELTANWPVGGFDITNIGNLGIGTDGPDQDLEVRGVSPIIRIRATGGIGNAAAYVEFGRTTGGNWVRTGFVGDAISGNEDIYLVAEDSNLKLGDSSSNAVLTLSGGNVTATNDIKAQTFSIGSASINEAELKTIDGIIHGTASPDKALILDTVKDISGIRNIGCDRLNINSLNIQEVSGDTIIDASSGDIYLTVDDDIFITSADENIFLTLGDDAGVKKVIIRNDNEATVATIDSDGGFVGTTFNTGTLSGNNSGDQSAGDFSHNSLAGLNDGTSFEHITQTQKDALHTQGTDTTLGTMTANINMDTFDIEGTDLDITAGTGDYDSTGTIACGDITSTNVSSSLKLQNDTVLWELGSETGSGVLNFKRNGVKSLLIADGMTFIGRSSTSLFEITGLFNTQIICNRGATDNRGDLRFETAGSLNWAVGSTRDGSFGDGTEFFIGQTQGGANPALSIDTSNVLTLHGELEVNGISEFGDGGTTNYTAFSATGDQTFNGSAGFYPRIVRQDGEPANGTGATQIDDEEQLIWIDTNDSNKVYLMFNDNTNTQVVKIQLQ